MNNFPQKVTFVFCGHNGSVYTEIGKENGLYFVTYWVVKWNYASVLCSRSFGKCGGFLEEVWPAVVVAENQGACYRLEKGMTTGMARFRGSQEQNKNKRQTNKQKFSHKPAPDFSYFLY